MSAKAPLSGVSVVAAVARKATGDEFGFCLKAVTVSQSFSLQTFAGSPCENVAVCPCNRSNFRIFVGLIKEAI